MKNNFFKRLWQSHTPTGLVYEKGKIDYPIREVTRDELFELYKSGIITKPELEALLRGEEISTVIDPK